MFRRINLLFSHRFSLNFSLHELNMIICKLSLIKLLWFRCNVILIIDRLILPLEILRFDEMLIVRSHVELVLSFIVVFICVSIIAKDAISVRSIILFIKFVLARNSLRIDLRGIFILQVSNDRQFLLHELNFFLIQCF